MMATNGAASRKTIMIAVDNSQACKKAVEFAKDNFPTGYDYHLLHVQANAIVPLAAGAGGAAFAWAGQEDCNTAREATSESFLRQFFEPQASAEGAYVNSTMLKIDSDGSGDIGSAICAFAEKHAPTALVMMKENKSGLINFFIGSVTKYCATHIKVPLIIVPEG